MLRLLFAVALIAGCAGSVKDTRSVAPRDSWGNRLRTATPASAGANHAQLLSAFRVLTDAVAAAAPEHRAELDRLRNACATLARSVDNPGARADFVKIGLIAAADALEAETLASLGASIDPGKPLRLQYDTIRRALLATADIMDRASPPVTARR